MSGNYSESDEENQHVQDVVDTLYRRYLNDELYIKKGKRYIKVGTGNSNLFDK